MPCPIRTQLAHPAVRPYLSRMFCRKCDLFVRLPLANSSFDWIVSSCCVLLAVAVHGLPTHKFKNCKSQAFSPSRHLTQNVFNALLLASTARIHRCGQACRQKHRASTSCSIWLHPLNGFGPDLSKCHNFSSVVLASDRTGRRSPGSLHLEIVCNPCSAELSNPSTHDQVQLLSCIPLSSLSALQSPSNSWIDTV